MFLKWVKYYFHGNCVNRKLYTFYAADAQFMFMFTNIAYDPKMEYALKGENRTHFEWYWC